MFSLPKPKDWRNLMLYQKICYYKLNLNEHYARFVNKIEAKKIVKEILKDEIKVSNIVKVLKDYKDFEMSDRNPDHVLKSAHASGWNMLDLDKATLRSIHCFLQTYNKTYKGIDEPHYSYITPQFFIEEKIYDKFPGNNQLSTFMFRCIHGKPQTFSIKRNANINNFDIEGNILKKKEHNFHIEEELFLKMKKFAEILSKPFEFVRIDFFIDYQDNIYFSEFTFTPCSGNKYYSDYVELKLGKLWT